MSGALARRRTAAAVVVFVLLYMFQFVVLGAPSAGAAVVYPWHFAQSSNVECSALDEDKGVWLYADAGTTWSQVKIETDIPEVGEAKEYTIGSGTLLVTQGSPGVFSFTSTVGIDSVLLKTGIAGHHFYVYDGLTAPSSGAAADPDDGVERDRESLGDEDLVVPAGQGNGISHISFCYDIEDTTTTLAPTTTVPVVVQGIQVTTTSTSIPFDSEVAVAGIQVTPSSTTTVPAVEAETLPFTGAELGQVAFLGAVVLVGGGLLLYGSRRGKHEEGTTWRT